MELSLHFFSALMMGLFGGLHCVGMCGGVSSALSFAVGQSSRRRRFGILLSYNIGRLGTYALMGAIVGSGLQLFFSAVGAEVVSETSLTSLDSQHVHHNSHDSHPTEKSFTNTFPQLNIARLIAGCFLVAMGSYLAGWWFGLVYLEKKVGGFLWRYLQPISQSIFPVTTFPKALLLGAIWGWLPCGLVYTALVFSASQAHVVYSAVTMLMFGLGTLPFLLLSGFFAEELKRFLQKKYLKQAIGLFIILFGLLTIAGAVGLHAHH